jgi:hypothetical protein
MSICFLSLSLYVITVFFRITLKLPLNPKDLTFLACLSFIFDRLGFYGFVWGMLFVGHRAAGTLSLIYSVSNFKEFKRKLLQR